jgi:hypothetical protein
MTAQWTGWRKSSRSANAGCCVEVAANADGIGVRDSKTPDRAILRFDPASWSGFLAGVKAGEFDLPA